MPTVGRPRVLDEDKQNTVCSLVAAGVSIREAADFLDCDPRSIRREADRNEDFRRRLAKAKSEARIHPLETLHRAAQTNWRAALHWMERLDPERFARPNIHSITQREANQFVEQLIATIERVVSHDRQRTELFDLLSAAMPAAMRRRWDARRVRRDIERATRASDLRKRQEAIALHNENHQRAERRRKLCAELKPYLPDELCAKLSLNSDLFDPQEMVAQRANGVPTNGGPTLVNNRNSASPAVDFVPPPRRNSDSFAPPPLTNPESANNLRRRGEAISTE